MATCPCVSSFMAINTLGISSVVMVAKTVDDATREGQVHVIVGRPINDGEEKLKGVEQCHGVVVELSLIGWVLCLENDIGC